MFRLLGLLVLLTAHVVPVDVQPLERGWRIWHYALEFLTSGGFGNSLTETLGFSTFFTLTLMIVAAPFLGRALQHSRLIKGLLATFLGIVTAVMGYFFFDDGADEPFFLLIALAPLLSFVGVLLTPSLPRPGAEFGASGINGPP